MPGKELKPIIGACAIGLGILIIMIAPKSGPIPTGNNESQPYTPTSGMQELHYDTEIEGNPVRVFVINDVSYSYQRNCPGSTTLLDFIDGYIECPLDGSRWNPYTGEFIPGSGPANISLRKFNLGGG